MPTRHRQTEMSLTVYRIGLNNHDSGVIKLKTSEFFFGVKKNPNPTTKVENSLKEWKASPKS